MSQKELAERMRDLGWKWSQSTVWSIEKGERPLRLAEAQDLLPIFDLVSIHELIGPSWDRNLAELIQRVVNTRESALRAIHAYNHARLDLAIAADEERIQDEPSAHLRNLADVVGIGPIELAEYYERWATNPSEGDVPKTRETAKAVWDGEEDDSFMSLFFSTSGYRGDRG